MVPNLRDISAERQSGGGQKHLQEAGRIQEAGRSIGGSVLAPPASILFRVGFPRFMGLVQDPSARGWAAPPGVWRPPGGPFTTNCGGERGRRLQRVPPVHSQLCEASWSIRLCSESCAQSRRGIAPSEIPAQDAERNTGETTRTPGSPGAKRTRTTEVTQTQR